MNEKDRLKKEIEIQKNIAYTAGLLQGDITIKTLLESLAEGVVIINNIGRIVLINRRFSEMSGYTKQDVMGESLNLFINNDLHTRHSGHLKKFFETPRIRPMGVGLELNAKRKDNSIFPVEISLSHLETESGTLGVAFITDISERKKTVDELNKRNIELDAYAHTVAHDLNSSLAGIIGFSELLITDEEIDKHKQDEYLKTIVQSGKKMSSIIRELLIFASMKKEDVEIKEVSMKDIIESACYRLKYQIENSNATVLINDHIINCKSYSSWIEEVWYNFISNAIKYGGNKPEITIFSEKVNGGYIKYSVKDNGQGVSDNLKGVIFHEKSSQKDKLTKGFGLGLSIVKKIVEKLDGKVSVESQAGEGSTFSFYIKE